MGGARTLGTLNPIKAKGVQHPSIIRNQRPAGPKEVLQPRQQHKKRRRGRSLDNLSPAVAEISKQGSSFSLLQNSAIENHHKPTASSLSSTSKDVAAATIESTSSAMPNKVHHGHEKLTEKPGLGSILGSLADVLNT
ncbi:hypothetical protein MUK42_02159, partial [Musa troglodytarum]